MLIMLSGMKTRRVLSYLWALPNTTIGLACMAVGSVYGRVRADVVDGVLELHGPPIDFLLRHGTLLPGGASAMTLGHVVLGRDEWALEMTRDHERVHVRQCERWGPLFIPMYLLTSLVMHLAGRDGYRDNFFEREAFDRFP